MPPRPQRRPRHGARDPAGGRDRPSRRSPGAMTPPRRSGGGRTSRCGTRRRSGGTGSSGGHFPDHPVAELPRAQRADAQGPELRADRRDHGRRHHVAAGDARRRAQLGLPVHLDPRLRVHALGPVHARLRLGGDRVLRLRHADASRHRRPADHVRDRRRARPHRAARSTTSPATRAPARCGSATAPTTSSSTTCGACCSTRSTSTPATGDAACPTRHGTIPTVGRGRRSPTGRSPTRASGRCAASPSTSGVARSCAGSPPTAAPAGARCAATRSTPSAGRQVADEIKADVCDEGRRRAGRVRPALRAPTPSTRRCC